MIDDIKISIQEARAKGIRSGIVGCEHSDKVRSEFEKMGLNMWSCDLLDTLNPSNQKHYKGDIFDIINLGWDIGIFHPPCTFLTNAQAWTFNRPDKYPDRHKKRQKAIEFAEEIWLSNIPQIAIENPVGFLANMSILGKPTQIIQPYDFGDNASKSTCLWLKNLPALIPTKKVPPRIVNGLPRWDNQTDSGQNKFGPSDDRWQKRSETFSGIAQAMAEKWANYKYIQLSLF